MNERLEKEIAFREQTAKAIKHYQTEVEWTPQVPLIIEGLFKSLEYSDELIKELKCQLENS